MPIDFSPSTLEMLRDYVQAVYDARYLPGYPGRPDGSGQYTFYVASYPGKLYVRMGGPESTTVHIATNRGGVPLNPFLKVWLTYENGELVIDHADAPMLRLLYGDYAGVASSLYDLLTSGGSIPGSLSPSKSGGLYVHVSAFYHRGGYWAGLDADDFDLTPNAVVTVGAVRWVKVYLNPTTNALGAAAGAEQIGIISDLTNAQAAAIEIPAGSYNQGAVALQYGQTVIDSNSHFTDARWHLDYTGYLLPGASASRQMTTDAITTGAESLISLIAQTGTTDDLKTITLTGSPRLIVLVAAATMTITLKHGTGNIYLASGTDFVLTGNHALVLYHDGTNATSIPDLDWTRPGALGSVTPNTVKGTTGDFTGILTTESGQIDKIRVVTAAGAVTVATTDYEVVVNKTVGAATVVNLPGSPVTGTAFVIRDGKGDAATNNLTLTPAAGNINGAGTLVISVAYGTAFVWYDGTQWQATVQAGGGSTSPLTTKGDLYGFSTLDARLPVGSNGTFLTADSTQTLGIGWAIPAVGGIVSTLNVNTTAVGNVGGGADNLITYSIPGGTLANDGDALHIVMVFQFATSVNSKQLQIVFGSTTIFDSTSLAITTAADAQADIWIVRKSATTELCIVEFTSGSSLIVAKPVYTAASETLSGALTIKGVGTGTTDNDIVQRGLQVYKYAATGTASNGNTITQGTYAGARPATPIAGDMYLPTDGYQVEDYSGSAWLPWGVNYPFTKPIAANYAWINQGTASYDETNGGIHLIAPTASSATQMRILKKTAPSTPYTITCAFLAYIPPSASATAYMDLGILHRESSSGKLTFLGLYVAPSATLVAPAMLARRMDNATGTNSTNLALIGSTLVAIGSIIWIRIADDGTNRIYSFSSDGKNFATVYSVTRTTFLTANEVGFYVSPYNSECHMTLLSWKEA